MTMLYRVQFVLDTLLQPAFVYSYWQTYEPVGSDPNPDEYVVYTLDGLAGITYADNQVAHENGAVTVRYYYSPELLKTSTGRNQVYSRMESIVQAMRDSGFGTNGGFSDVGDVDDVGMNTAVCEFSGGRSDG